MYTYELEYVHNKFIYHTPKLETTKKTNNT